MLQLDLARVGPEEIDSLGHLNVRFYLARIDPRRKHLPHGRIHRRPP